LDRRISSYPLPSPRIPLSRFAETNNVGHHRSPIFFPSNPEIIIEIVQFGKPIGITDVKKYVHRIRQVLDAGPPLQVFGSGKFSTLKHVVLDPSLCLFKRNRARFISCWVEFLGLEKVQNTAAAIRSAPTDHRHRKVTHGIVSRPCGPATSNDRVIFVEQAAHTHPDRFSFLVIHKSNFLSSRIPAYCRRFYY
jgi:hypothetical protein